MSCLFEQQHAFYKIIMASLIFMGGAVFFYGPVLAQAEPVNLKMQTEGEYRYMASNGLPADGAAGAAPQDYVFRMALKPVKKEKPAGVPETMFFGVALDGVPFKALTKGAQNIDAKGGVLLEGAAFVYVKAPVDLLDKDLSHLGYAADGFPVFYSKKNLFKSGYGADGKFVSGQGNLDRCNGAVVNNKYYIYVLIDEYPNIPLCWSGAPDPTFVIAGAPGALGKPVKMPSETIGADGVLKPVIKSQEVFIEENRKRRSHLDER